MLAINKNVFTSNLLLTQRYCYKQLIASKKITPDVLRSTAVSDDRTNVDFYDYVTEELFEKHWNYKNQRINTRERKSKFNGDLLVIETQSTLFEGASESASEGFFDSHDCPPIDTWFYMTDFERERLLFTWVPEEFIHLIDDAILVNSTNCINWFSEKFEQEYKYVNNLP
jgi:hypothetical protein